MDETALFVCAFPGLLNHISVIEDVILLITTITLNQYLFSNLQINESTYLRNQFAKICFPIGVKILSG